MGSIPKDLVLEDVHRPKKSQDGQSSYSRRSRGEEEVVLRVPRSNSVSSERRSRKSSEILSRSTVPVIDEEKELGFVTRNGSKYASNDTLSNSSHQTRAKKYSRQQNGSGVVNMGYSGSTPSIASSSMPVVHEQYCYCTRWSKLEKTLGIAVSVLVFMVFVLVIAVGLLGAERKGNNQSISPKMHNLFGNRT